GFPTLIDRPLSCDTGLGHGAIRAAPIKGMSLWPADCLQKIMASGLCARTLLALKLFVRRNSWKTGSGVTAYLASLARHYANNPPANWRQGFGSAHPWEDSAETWAHYLHIVDTLETAHAFGLWVRPGEEADPALSMEIDFDPYHQRDFDALMRAWLPLTYVVNSLNHSMGLPNLYPFVLAPAVMGKLRFVHGLIFR
ncbi:putative zinc-binding metallopeptidase, partial [Skermanella aerolata]